MIHLCRRFSAILAAFAALVCVGLSVPAAAESYADGAYSVPFAVEGLGRHNIAHPTATLHVENGALYLDFTLERVDPRDHAPQYDFLTTEYGDFVPVLDEAAFTCTFQRVQIPHLGRVEVTAQTSAMSQPYGIDYVLVIDGSAVPAAEPPAPAEEPAPAESTAPENDPAPAEEPAPVEEPDPLESAAPAEEPAPTEAASPTENSSPVEETVPAEAPAPAEALSPAEESAPAGPRIGLPIVVAASLALLVCVFLLKITLPKG